MSRACVVAWLAFGLLASAGCQASADDAVTALIASKTAVAREARLKSALASSDTVGETDAPLARWVLPPSLREISGLALTRDGRLFVHGNERGQLWEIDYRRGALLKRFTLGDQAVIADFEGITVANDVLWMLASNGTLYEFREGGDDAHVKYQKYETGLKKDCEFEGVAFDPKLNAMLLACKNIREKQDRKSIIIYRWSLKPGGGERVSRLMVPVASVRGDNAWTSLQISDITIEPSTGNYVLVASKERAIVVITPTGDPVSARVLPERHEQPEGIALTKDSLLLISDEAAKGPAVLTLYRWP